MKTIALLLIAVSFLQFAILSLKSLKARLSALKKASIFLQCISIELSLEAVPMQEMFQNIARRNCGRESALFEKMSEDMGFLGEKSFNRIWSENIHIYFKELLDDEKTELINLSDKLGLCPVDMQLAYISKCEAFLADRYRQESLQYPQLRKLYLGLSAAAAAAVIIVFI